MNRFSRPMLLAFLLAVAANAQAAVDVQRDVTLTDDAGGTLVITTQGTLEIGGSESLTTAEFDGFQPNADGRTINGQMVRSRYRDLDELVTTYDGLLESESTDADGNPVINTLVLENLQVRRDGDGPEFSGQVTWNGETVDAAELPPQAIYILRRALRFFRFA
ncbi:hypothetical protein [Halomonas denitrificans]|nr:hypothetical protein [Halomonas denitrificans]